MYINPGPIFDHQRPPESELLMVINPCDDWSQHISLYFIHENTFELCSFFNNQISSYGSFVLFALKPEFGGSRNEFYNRIKPRINKPEIRSPGESIYAFAAK